MLGSTERSFPGRYSRCVFLLAALGGAYLLIPTSAMAQDNYEIQVYGSELVPVGRTMVELHSNFTIDGRTTTVDGLAPTDHALHETLEVTHGFSDWFEVGFYMFTSVRNGSGWDWVGDHIRPRLSIPARWGWPVGLSLSQEIGYQRRRFSPDTWTWEIRPIIDKQMGRWYWAFNPTFERALVGEGVHQGFEFSPNAQVTFDVTPQVTAALEYYGALGPVTGFDPLQDQEQQIFPSIDLNVSPDWELNFGVGRGFTRSTDHLLVKAIVGYRLAF